MFEKLKLPSMKNRRQLAMSMEQAGAPKNGKTNKSIENVKLAYSSVQIPKKITGQSP